ncbi:hypothetical protein C8Q78DRAFT_552718 [Trametes maxima]|nr:hypothetical protein C8Q78DRAFT_552718 [Trametes maxima]
MQRSQTPHPCRPRPSLLCRSSRRPSLIQLCCYRAHADADCARRSAEAGQEKARTSETRDGGGSWTSRADPAAGMNEWIPDHPSVTSAAIAVMRVWMRTSAPYEFPPLLPTGSKPNDIQHFAILVISRTNEPQIAFVSRHYAHRCSAR